jgi:hypothetical protein
MEIEMAEQESKDVVLIPFDKGAMENLETAVQTYVNARQVPVIDNDEDLKAARDLFNEVRARIKQVDADAEPIRKPLREALDALYERIRRAKEPLSKLEGALTGAIKNYARLVDAKMKELADREAKERLERAAELERQGHVPQAQEVLRQAEVAEATPAPAPGPKLDQRTFGKKWFARVTDQAAFYRGIADGKVPQFYAPIEITKLNTLARNTKGADLGLPGVVGYEE